MNGKAAAMAVLLILISAAASAAQTTMISRKSQKAPSNGASGEPVASETGQFVAFRSAATNLDSDRCKNGFTHIFVRDRNTGTIRCVSVNANDNQADRDSLAPSISGDGRFVSFTSTATNLDKDRCENGLHQIYLHDRVSGTTRCISVNSNDRHGNGDSHAPFISEDGRFIAFDSAATNLTGNECDSGRNHIFVHDRAAGTTTCVSVRSNRNEANGDSFDPSLTSDGRVVVFHSTATNLAPRCDNGNSHIYIHDLDTGGTHCVSQNNDGQQSNGNSTLPRVSADGRFVVFQSDSTNVTRRCVNGAIQIFVRDLVEGRITCASIDKHGNQGNDDSVQPSISSDGRFVAFSSEATNLSGRCADGVTQVFLRDRLDEQTGCASVGPKKVKGNGASTSPSIAANGTLVTFESDASNLVKKDLNGLRDVFARGISTSRSSDGDGGSFVIIFDLLQGDEPTGGLFLVFD